MVPIVVRDSDQRVLRFGSDAGAGETNRTPPLANVPTDMTPGFATYAHAGQRVTKGVGADSALKTKAIATVQAGLRLDHWAGILLANFTSVVRDRYHDIRLFNRMHMYLVLSAPTSGNGSYSVSQKNTYLDELVKGPTNHTVTTTSDTALRAAVLGVLKDARALPTPTQPSHWVNPATGARTSLQAMNTLTGSIPDAVVLDDDDWVRGLNI